MGSGRGLRAAAPAARTRRTWSAPRGAKNESIVFFGCFCATTVAVRFMEMPSMAISP